MRRLLTAAFVALLALAGASPAVADDGYVDLALKIELTRPPTCRPNRCR